MTTQQSNLNAAVVNVNRTFGDNRYTTRTEGNQTIISGPYGDYPARSTQEAWQTMQDIENNAQGRGSR